MTKKVIYTDRLMKPIAHFSHAVRIGNVIHIGATAGTDSQRRLNGSVAGMVDISEQTRRMFDNVAVVLGLLGARLEHTVRIKTYISDIRDQKRYRELYDGAFGRIAPDHIVVGSAGFPLPQAAIELDLIAVVDEPITRTPGVGVAAAGRFYCSCSKPCTQGNFEDYAMEVLLKVRKRVERGGFSASKVASLHVTLADCRDVTAFDRALEKAFDAELPACTLVVAPLADERALCQVEAIAAAGELRRLAGGQSIGSAGVIAGDDLYIGGKVGEQRDGQLAVGTRGQTVAAWDGVRAVLSRAGMNSECILRTNNVLTDWRFYVDFNAGYGANVSEPFPPRATVLGGLARSGAVVQIEAVAHRLGAEATIVQVPDV